MDGQRQDLIIERKIGLDLVRAAAISLVVISHFLNFYAGLEGSIYTLGYAGVELFFALSGYLIGGIFLKSMAREITVTPKFVGRFWLRRWLRTLPNYWLFIPVYMYVDGLTLKSLPLYLLFAKNFAWPMKGGFGLSWSLAVEEWFYLLLPALVLVLTLLTRKPWRAFLITVGIMLIGPVLARTVLGPGHLWDAGIRKIVVLRLDAIMLGVVLAYIQIQKPHMYARLQRPIAFAVGFGLFLLATSYIGWRYAHVKDFVATRLDVFCFLAMSIGCTLILPAAAQLRGHRGAVSTIVQSISLWSYSIYLCHRPVMQLLGRDPQRSWAVQNVLIPIAALSIVLIGSGLIFNFFELPIMRWRDRTIPGAAGAPAARTEALAP